MDRRTLGGWILGVLVGLTLLGTATVATIATIGARSSAVQAVSGSLHYIGAKDILNGILSGEAVAVGSPGVPTADTGARTQNFLKTLGNALVSAMESSGKLLVKNTLGRLLGELAKGTANWIATGSPGQLPLFEHNNFYDFAASQRDAATAEFLDSLGQTYGVDVCNPDVGAKLVIHYSAAPSVKLQSPRCSLQTIQERWAELLPDQDAFLREFSLALQPDQNDLGVALTVSRRLANVRETKANAAILERLESQGLKPLKDLAGNIITPAVAVQEQIRQTLGLSAQKELAFIGDPVADAIGIFVNTLGNRLQEKWLKKGFINIADVFNRTGSGQLFGGTGRYSVAEPRFAALAELELGSSGAVDVLPELTVCSNPNDPGYGSQCVLDTSFAQAVQQQLTVREAMDRGLLRGEWPFGYLADGSEPRYGTGYAYSSMAILRTKRVLPVGWELAAQVAKALNVAVTLDHVVGCYEDPEDAGNPARPASCVVGDVNPFYHLVDPNWLLKVPAAYCVRSGASADLLVEQFTCIQDTNGDGVVDCVNEDSNIAVGGERSATLVDRDPTSKDDYYRLLQRAEYCADEQSCVAEAPDGSCRAYGYCFEEKPTFTLGDASCPAQFASCIGVTTPSGQRTAYLEDSLQMCPTGAAGCRWYSTRPSGNVWSGSASDRIYLNGEASTCSAQDAGCRKLLRFGQGVNLVPNGGFEQYDRGDGAADARRDSFHLGGTATGIAFTVASQVYEGSASFLLRGGSTIVVQAETGNEVAGRQFVASVATKGCAGTIAILNGDGGNVGTPATLAGDPNDSWHTSTVAGTTQAPGTSLTVQLAGLAGDNCYVDALTLAEGSQPAALAYGAGPSVHLSSRAQACTQDDVGCQAFTPTSGDPTVFGRVTANDYCPSECVGYQSFSSLRTSFEQLEGAPDPADEMFIPSTGRSCSALDVGCSEFTNLGEVEEGGERVAYFSQVQQCVPQGTPNVGTYYTWEGSDTTGYQLRVWQLLVSDTATPASQVPCTNLSLDASIQPPVCRDGAAGHTPATCSADDPDPDCREVFDANAASHRVRWSRVVQATGDCRQYRRTGTDAVYSISPQLARRCPASANGCRQYRGATGGNTRTVLLADFESSGAGGWGGARLALTSEALQVGGHSLLVQGSAGGSVTLRRTGTLPYRPGRQYMLTAWVKGSDRVVPTGNSAFRSGLGRLLGALGAQPATAQSGTVDLAFDGSATDIGSEWQLVRLGPVSGGAGGELTFQVTLGLADGLQSAYFDNIQLKEVASDVFAVRGSWSTPQSCDNPPGLPNGTAANPRTEPGAMVGCSAYRMSRQQVNLRSFTRLCAQENVGCQAFVDTANSASPFAQRFNATCSLGAPVSEPTTCSSGGYQRCVVGVGSASCRYTETNPVASRAVEGEVSVPADRVAYYVDSPAAYCSPEVAGCAALGQPQVNRQSWAGTGDAPADGIVGWQEVYRVASPDQFGRTLCTTDQLWCASHRLAEGGSSVFRDPLGSSAAESRTCEYRTGVQVGERLVTGWFRTGTDGGCRSSGDYTLPLEYSPGYGGFVGLCPAQYSGCTNYRNPKPSQTGGQVNNYFLRSSVDSSSCNGLVDVAGGCMLLFDPNQPPLYSSTLSYPPNRLPGQPPVASSTLDTNVVLKVRRDRTCSQWYTCGSSVAVPGSATGQRVCTSLTSCSQLDPATNQCANPGSGLFRTGSAVAGEFTFNGADASESDKWKNLSGYTQAGIQLGAAGIISRGYAPLSSMPQVGQSVRVSNGDFEQSDGQDDLLTGADWGSCDSGSPAVPASQACSYATAAGRVAEGRAALKLATTLNAGAEVRHSPIALSPGIEYSASVQMNTSDLASGEVVLEVLGSGGNPLLTLRQDSGKGWQTKLGRFEADGVATIRVAASDAASGVAYVDDVKIQPVLQVSPAPLERYVGQQCRVYPRSDAPSCRYTQDDGEYRGIVGYCLQPDPRDPSRCIQWWPVDVVAGQSLDVFGETISLGGRTPLLYCTEAAGNADGSGNYWRQTWNLVNTDDNTGGTLTYHSTTTDPSSWEWSIHWSQVASFFIRVNDGSGEYVPEAYFLGQLRYWTFSDSEGSVNNQFGFYSGQYHAGNYHSLFIGVNPNTGFIESYRGWADDDTGGFGEYVTMHVYFVLKEQCEVVAQVRSGDEHTAWFTRFNGGEEVNTGDAFALRIGDDANPYGAASANVTTDLVAEMCDSSVLGSTTLAIARGCALPVGRYPTLNGGAQVERAGTPLACPAGQCGSPQCTRDRSNRCDPATDDRQQCFDLGNPLASPPDITYCIGTPTGTSVPSGNRDVGAIRLSNLFARSYATWAIDPTTRRYVSYDCENGTHPTEGRPIREVVALRGGSDSVTGCWDRRPNLTADADLPQVGNIEVNGVGSGEVAGSAGSRVELTFTSQLSLQRLPLRYISIDWGGGNVERTARLSINHQPNDLAPHLFEKFYSAEEVAALPTCSDGSGKCATIKVQVEDNWGYCNGPSFGGYSLADLDQYQPGCGPASNARWTSASVTIRFPSGGGGGFDS